MAPSTKDRAIKVCMTLPDFLKVSGIPVYILSRMEYLPTWLQLRIEPHKPLLVLLLIISTFSVLHIMYKLYVSNSKISPTEMTLLSTISVFGNATHKPVPATILSRVFNGNITVTCQKLSELLSRKLVICSNREGNNPMDFTYMLSPKGTLSIQKSPKNRHI